MNNSILFLGRFDNNMLFLEAKIISFGKPFDKKQNILTKKKELLQNPDVIKYQINRYGYDAWIIIGDVKPTLLLKKLISDVQIILFVFNADDPETLDFLNEGWGPIFDKSKPKISQTQQRFLIGTYGQIISKSNQQNLNSKIQKAMEKFECSDYFEEEMSNFQDKNHNTPSNLFNTLQKQFSKVKTIKRNVFKELKSENDDSSNNFVEEKIKSKHDDDRLEGNKNVKKQKNDRNICDFIVSDDDDDFEDQNIDNNNDNFEEKNIDDDNFEEENNEINNDDDFDENEIKDDEKIEFKDIKSIEYNLYKKSKIAEIVHSPKSKGDITIPTFIEFGSIQYTIRRVCDSAFSNSKIESLSFSNNSKVKVIGNNVFENSQIKEFYIPSSLTKLNEYWCKGADNLIAIEVDKNSKFFSFKKNFLIRVDQDQKDPKKIISKKILFSPRNFSGDLCIPEGITHIESYAFSHLSKLYSLNSKSSFLTVINSYSILGCESLRKIEINKSHELTLKDFCFSDAANLQSVEIDCNEITIGGNCFFNCPLLSHLKFKNAKKITICTNSFNECPNLNEILANNANKLVLIINKNESIESSEKNFKLFKNCDSIASVVIKSESNIDILSHLLLNIGCKYIKIKSNSQLTIKKFFFAKSIVEKIKLVGNKLNVDYSCFQNYKELDSLIIQSEDDIIFNEKNYLNYKSLKNLIISSKKDIYFVNKFLNEDVNLESINLNARKVKIGKKCFENLKFIQNLTIFCDDVNIDSDAFKNCSKLSKIEINSKSKLYVRNHCFAFCHNLNTIDFNSVDLLLLNYCFFNCSSINSLNLSDFNKVSISDNVFEGCNQLNNIKIKAKEIFYAGKSCFKNLNKLSKIEISSKKITIDEFCFEECQSISEIKIEEAKEILLNNYAFYKCTNINNINIAAELQFTLGLACFTKAINLTDVNLSGHKITINDNCFDNCSSLNSFTVKNSNEVYLGKCAFTHCKKLVNLCIKDASSFKAGVSCFENAEMLSSVQIESKNIFLDENCFKKCKKMNQIACNVADNIEYIKNAFNGVPLKNYFNNNNNQNPNIKVFNSKRKYLKDHKNSS